VRLIDRRPPQAGERPNGRRAQWREASGRRPRPPLEGIKKYRRSLKLTVGIILAGNLGRGLAPDARPEAHMSRLWGSTDVTLSTPRPHRVLIGRNTWVSDFSLALLRVAAKPSGN
ncbi:MAG: hypothetical protein O9325_05790, partial [Roseomonas sp.]|nr:hypothetical protein [Roseomonas sp.]